MNILPLALFSQVYTFRGVFAVFLLVFSHGAISDSVQEELSGKAVSAPSLNVEDIQSVSNRIESSTMITGTPLSVRIDSKLRKKLQVGRSFKGGGDTHDNIAPVAKMTTAIQAQRESNLVIKYKNTEERQTLKNRTTSFVFQDVTGVLEQESAINNLSRTIKTKSDFATEYQNESKKMVDQRKAEVEIRRQLIKGNK